MENLLDLLIILFIIYAFLSPLFKKRTPPVQKRPEPVEPEIQTEKYEEKTSQDILKEIEKLFGYPVEEEKPYTYPTDDEVITFEPESSEHKTAYEPKFEEKIVQPKFEEKIILPKLKQKGEDEIHSDFFIEAYDYEGTLTDTSIDDFDYSKIDVYGSDVPEVTKETEKRAFVIELNNMDDLKNAIVYREIFDTPIALRMRKIKWQRSIY